MIPKPSLRVKRSAEIPAAAKFSEAVKALAGKMDRTSQAGMTDVGCLATFNHALIEVGRDFLLPNGLPDRA